MDLDRYYELRTILQQWRLRLAEGIRARIEDSARRLERLRRTYADEGTDEEFNLWLDRWCRQAAIQFILRVLFLRVLEDRDLLGVTRLRTTDGQGMWAQLTRNLGAAAYVQWCCRDAAHLLPDLFGPTEYDFVLPDDEAVQRFLDDVWRRPDPDRPGWLRFDFRPDPARGDEGFETRFIGDLYQELDAEIRERYALLQTPHFVSQFILEHTLLERFEEKDFREVTLIDPTCGSGHFLVDAFWMFVERYEKCAPGLAQAGDAQGGRAEIARTIIEQHLYGCDINPYATALARFRLALAACDYARPTSLREFGDLHFNLVTIDSLIPYERRSVGQWREGSAGARVLGQPEAIERALPVLRRRYDVVVGNPPYILASDAVKRDLYRQNYEAASGKFNLSAPFTERFIDLATSGGHVGLIESNAFTQRSFGRALVEKALSSWDLRAVVDLSGAYIPGHGTPTLILVVVKGQPTGSTVKVVACRRGETAIPSDPARGVVWTSIAKNYREQDFNDHYVQITEYTRRELGRHPWSLSPDRGLLRRIERRGAARLGDLASYLGPGCLTGVDDIYLMTVDQARRERIEPAHLKWAVRGEDIRDWTMTPNIVMLVPYTRTAEGLKPSDEPSVALSYLERFRDILASRSPLPSGRAWFELCRSAGAEALGKDTLGLAYLATHNHYAWNRGSLVYQRSGYSLWAADEAADDLHAFYDLLAAALNTSVVCFFLKQTCFNKGTGDDPVRDRYDHAAANVSRIPICEDLRAACRNRRCMLLLSEEMLGLAGQFPALGGRKLFELEDEAYHASNSALEGYVSPHPELPPPFGTARELRAARDKFAILRQDIRARMIFLQEEMDWLAYEMYGLLKARAPLAEDYLSRTDYQAGRLELGQRAFEVAGKGYTGDWPQGYEPAPLPESLRPLTDARIAVIRANPDVALLEDPLYKRRWIPPDYGGEFREAAEWWLAEKLEWVLEQHGRPIALPDWPRRLGRDERVNAVLEVLAGTPHFDLEEALLRIIRANAVPNRPEHYLKPAGLRKFHAARQSDQPGTPEYRRAEFSDAAAWRLRGRLNIPRERFIHYAELDHTQRAADAPECGGPWFGWAGWDAAQRADALAFLLDRANRAGWEVHWRQCGLRAALRDLLPELRETLPEREYLEFEGIAGMCAISPATACYCQAYCDGIARGEPGVPGVGEEVLGLRIVAAQGMRPRRGRGRCTGDAGAEQLGLGLR